MVTVFVYVFYLFFFLRFLSKKKVIAISGDSDLRRYTTENHIDICHVRCPFIKPYHFYFDHTIQSHVVNGTEGFEVLLSSVWKILKKTRVCFNQVGSKNNYTYSWENYLVIALLTAIFHFTTHPLAKGSLAFYHRHDLQSTCGLEMDFR